MAVAGTASYLVQLNRVDARVSQALEQEVEEFRAIARTGVDPATGQPFTTVRDLFYVALQRNVPDRNEAFLTIVGGSVAYESAPARRFQLEEVPELVAATSSIQPTEAVVLGTEETEQWGTLRYAAVPVTVEGDPEAGVFVIGYALDREQAEVLESARTFALVALGSLLLVALVSWFVAGRLLRPVRLLRDAAHRVSSTDIDQRIEVTGNDDLSDLARTFNGMLDRLQAAFAAQRQLLDDVGHELRTPITVVRGHIELMDPADEDDVRETRGLALDELDRMHRLVDDLVLLAKAKRPDFLRRSAVEVGPLVDEVLDKARALGPRRWTVDARADVVVPGDPQRLTQALLQLAANAVAVTTRADGVAFGSSTDGREVRLWVRDTGPGVAEEDRERIFERFARGADPQGREGSGLGLAIVTAIADAHGGRIELDSTPGRGATFTIVLPDPRDEPPAVPASPAGVRALPGVAPALPPQGASPAPAETVLEETR